MGRRPLAALTAVLALAGCGGGSDEEVVVTETGAETTVTATEPPSTTTVEGVSQVALYYMDGEHLKRFGADLADASDPAVAVEALLENASGRPTEIPTGTELNGVGVADGTATVDLSSEFASGGGSLSMQARVAQVVYTLTQFPFVSRVTFRIDGEDVEGIGGDGVPAREVTRDDLTNVLPPIFVDRPAPDTLVTGPVAVSGSASVFEANVSLRLEGPGGEVLAETFATAEEGAPGRGDFEATLGPETPVEEPTAATIVAYEQSAATGEETHVVRIPVTLVPGG